jgi:hypothetical protein
MSIINNNSLPIPPNINNEFIEIDLNENFNSNEHINKSRFSDNTSILNNSIIKKDYFLYKNIGYFFGFISIITIIPIIIHYS